MDVSAVGHIYLERFETALLPILVMYMHEKAIAVANIQMMQQVLQPETNKSINKIIVNSNTLGCHQNCKSNYINPTYYKESQLCVTPSDKTTSHQPFCSKLRRCHDHIPIRIDHVQCPPTNLNQFILSLRAKRLLFQFKIGIGRHR